MRSTTVEERGNLFSARRDAVLYLIGLGGFWGGVAGALVAADAAPSSLVIVVFFGIGFSCAFVLMSATRKFEARLSGRQVRPWPFGYPSFRTQVIATLPSTVIAAAQRLKLNAIVVIVAMYSALVIALVAFVALWTRR